MRLGSIAVFAWLLIAANPARAYNLSHLFQPVLLPEEDQSEFVAIPTIIAGFVGLTPGVIIGIPLAVVGGTLTTLIEGDPSGGAAAGMFFGVVGGSQIFSNAVGVPLWTAEKVFYDLPEAAFSSEDAVPPPPSTAR